MKPALRITAAALTLALALGIAAAATRIVVPKGTLVTLLFDQALSSKTAKIGDLVKLHVKQDVVSSGETILKTGAKVTGTITRVDKRKRYGVNARLRLTLDSVPSEFGRRLPLAARTSGKFAGEKTGGAAAATVGGAAVLGPVGLAGGYFVAGKHVEVKVGEELATEVTKDVVLKRK